MISSRQRKILQYLILHNNPISIDELANHVHVTTRTIRSDIKDITNSLEEFSFEIFLVRNQGYELKINDFEAFNQFFFDDSSQRVKPEQLETADKRIKHLIVNLIYAHDYLSLDDLANSVYVSHSSMLSYLKNIRSVLKKYNLELENKSNIGYKVKGLEKDKRLCLADMIAGDVNQDSIFFSQEQLSMFSDIDLELIRHLVTKTLPTQLISITDLNLKNLIVHIALMISRLKNKTPIGDFKIVTQDKEVIDTLNTLLEDIEGQYQITIPDGERSYLYSHLIRNSSTRLEIVSDEFVQKSVNEILRYLFERFGYNFQNDHILINDLVNHFKSILAVKYYKLKIRNPMLEDIMKSFPFEFEVALIAVNKVFNDSDYNFTPDDLSYIALHLGAAFERHYAKPKRLINIILVCGSGMATTRLVEARIQRTFGNKLKIIDKISYSDYLERTFENYDVLISTIPIKVHNNEKPYVYMRLPFDQRDMDSLKSIINDFQKFREISHFFDEDLFFTDIHTKSKNDIINTICKNLEMKGLVTSNFFDSVLKREELASTLLDYGICIPHPLDEFASQSRVAIAILDKPIIWSNNQYADIIFLLAFSKDDKNHLSSFYEIFIDLMNNPLILNKAKRAKNLTQFLDTVISAQQQ